MRVVTLAQPDDFDRWRDAARGLMADDVPPDDVVWQVGDAPADLFGTLAPDPPAASADRSTPAFSVPRAFIDLARSVILGSDPERFALLYTLLARLRREPKLIEDRADPLVGLAITLVILKITWDSWRTVRAAEPGELEAAH